MISKESVSLEEKVYATLEDAILANEYKKGDALTELGICEKLGVSRTPVRSALHRLAEDGLISITPNRGAVVVGVTKNDLIDIYRIRMRLEGLACAMAAEKMNSADKKALRDSVELAEFYIAKKDAEHVQKLDTEFHRLIYQASGSRMLCKILSDLHRSIRAYRKCSLCVAGRLEKSVYEHREILEAIEAGDVDEADRLSAEHVSRALTNILSVISENQKS